MGDIHVIAYILPWSSEQDGATSVASSSRSASNHYHLAGSDTGTSVDGKVVDMPSTSITFTTDSSLFDLFIQAACASYGYRGTVPDPANPGQVITNPQTPAQFAQQKVIDYCVEVIRAYQTELAAQQARKTASDTLDTQVAGSPIQVTVS